MRGWIIRGEMGESHQQGEHWGYKNNSQKNIRRKKVIERFKNYEPSKKKLSKKETHKVCMNGTKLKQ